MDREKKCEELRHNAWDKATNVQDRIKRLEKVAEEYPEYMIALSDIAVSYLNEGDINAAIEMYQNIIDRKDTFAFVWQNNLGKAYLFTKDYDNAISTLKNSTVVCYDQGLFLAFSYLKNNDVKTFKKQFEKWLSEDLKRSFDQYSYKKKMEVLFDADELEIINNIWSKYYEKYTEMDKYELYCALYKQCYKNSFTDEDGFDDDELEIPEKLNRNKFEFLSSEYLSLDRMLFFGNPSDADYDRHSELSDLLFSETVWE